jgi:hypothetical protein
MRQVIIYPGEDGYWVAECPSSPGCINSGEYGKRPSISNISKKMNLLFFILLVCTFMVACPNSKEPRRSVETNNTTKVTNRVENQKTIKTEDVSQKGNDISAFMPNDWHLLEKVQGEPELVEGDLNNDGIKDIAAVIEGKSTKEEAAPRAIIIALGNKDKSYTLSTKAEKAILRADEGGLWGDPFEKISIDRGSILISFYGGSNWRWFSSYRFRFQDNDWYLIGATRGSYFTGTTTRENADETDYNLLTGDFVQKKANEQGELVKTKGNRGKKMLVKLEEFDAQREDIQF